MTRLLIAGFTLAFLGVLALDVTAIATFWVFVIAGAAITAVAFALFAVVGLLSNPGAFRAALARRRAERARILSRNALLKQIKEEAAQCCRELGIPTTADREAAKRRQAVQKQKARVSRGRRPRGRRLTSARI